LVYERTDWRAYDTLDFDYGDPLNNPFLTDSFDDPIQKHWRDSDTYRFGFRCWHHPSMRFILGFAMDETPVHETRLNFEIPDADAMIFSA